MSCQRVLFTMACLLLCATLRAHAQTQTPPAPAECQLGQSIVHAFIMAHEHSVQHMPDARTCPVATAVKFLELRGFKVALHPVQTAGPANIVASQYPQPGTVLQPNESIQLYYSKDSNQPGSKQPASVVIVISNRLATYGQHHPGEQVTFTLLVQNNGSRPAPTLLLALTPVNLALTTLHGCDPKRCAITGLAAGGTKRIDVDATIQAPGNFFLQANASAVDPPPDLKIGNPKPAGGFAEAVPETPTIVDLTVEPKPLVIEPDKPHHVGDVVAIPVLVRNTGTTTANDVRIISKLPGLQLENIGPCKISTCTVPAFAPGASVRFTITAKIKATGTFPVVVAAVASQPEAHPGSNEARASIQVGLSPPPSSSPPPSQSPSPSPSPPRPQPTPPSPMPVWPFVAIILTSLASGAAAVLACRHWWPRANVSIDPASAESTASALPLAQPAVAIHVAVLPGNATASNLPILREEVSHA